MGVKTWFGVIGFVLALSLSITIANKLSEEAIAVVVGAVCGISASVPMAIGLAIAASRGWGQRSVERIEPEQSHYPYVQQPPIYIMAPPQSTQYPMPQYGQYPMLGNGQMTPVVRDFKIIGDE